MSSTRIWADAPKEEELIITGPEYNHLAHVLRVKVGDPVTVIAGDAFDRLYQITAITKKQIVLQFVTKTENRANPARPFTVFMAAIKPEPLAWAVQKLNEIGVTALKLFVTDFSVVALKNLNLARLNEIAKQSCKQCGRSMPLRVSVVTDIWREDLTDAVFLDEKSTGVNYPEKVRAVIVGPEGGFSAREREKLAQVATPVSLGPRILRAETAAIVGASKWCI